jgi:hypothetical protein
MRTRGTISGTVVLACVLGFALATPAHADEPVDPAAEATTTTGPVEQAPPPETTVPEVAPAPVVHEDAFADVPRGEVFGANVLDNDEAIPAEGATVSVVREAVNGTVALEADGAFTYVLDVPDAASDDFVYEVATADAVYQTTATLTFEPVAVEPAVAAPTAPAAPAAAAPAVAAVQQPVVLTEDNCTAAAGNTCAVDVFMNDPPGNPQLVVDPTSLRVGTGSRDPMAALSINADGAFVYQPAANHPGGVVEFLYDVQLASGGTVQPATGTIVATVSTGQAQPNSPAAPSGPQLATTGFDEPKDLWPLGAGFVLGGVVAMVVRRRLLIAAYR